MAGLSKIRRETGFTLVELIVIMGILTVLLSLATLEFKKYSVKSAIEGQTRVMMSDLTKIRSEALFEKRRRAVKFTSTAFSVYSSEVSTVSPVQTKSLSYPLTLTDVPDPLVFTGRGLLEGVSDGAAVCIGPAGNEAGVDSIVLNTTRVHIGKRNGTNCQASDIETK
jgi:type IV fimbrial biogenesis protein FimT